MQFSLFGAAAAEASIDDLDGVLLGGGHWVRSGSAARLSVVVADRWRADALNVEFCARAVGEPDEPVVRAEGGCAARTAFSADLIAAADRWTRGARQVTPGGFNLTAGGLRLWAIAAGRPCEGGYLLGTAAAQDPIHLAAGAALARHGLTASSVAQARRDGLGPGWRVTSVKRLRRLAELLGEPPAGGDPFWPVP